METTKPIAKVIGKDGNVFNTLSICVQSLERANLKEKSEEMTKRVFNAGSYHEALNIMREYCTLK